MDDILGRTLIEAQESNTTQVKLTPRIQETCAFLEATGLPAE